jgi:hypothetical protein
MVTAVRIQRDTLSWVSPSPMWRDLGDLGAVATRAEFVRPAILRFAHDAFMDELLATLAYNPTRLGEWRATAETWESPMRSPPSAARLALAEPVSALSTQIGRRKSQTGGRDVVKVSPADDGEPPRPLKLYQPIQLRHYMVTASLVCQRPGLPDRSLDRGKQESATFVVRRILLPDGATAPAADPDAWDECAFVPTESGPTWRRVKELGGRADRVLPGEERLPLFSLSFDETPERRRRVYGGVIPVGRREAYVAARLQAASSGADGGGGSADIEPAPDPRRLLFQMQVTAPWNSLVESSLDEIIRFEKVKGLDPVFGENPPPLNSPRNAEAATRAREQVQTTSWYALVDFERFLQKHLAPVHDVLTGKLDRAALNAPELALLDRLEAIVLSQPVEQALGQSAEHTLRDALARLANTPANTPSFADGLEAVDVPYDSANPDPRWPTFLFPLANSLLGNVFSSGNPQALQNGPFPFIVAGQDLSGRAADREEALTMVEDTLLDLADLVEAALPPADTVALPEIHLPVPSRLDAGAPWFAIRCLYERPNCGPLDPPVVSEATRVFQMAGYFDPDAPVRPVRIPMPIDISPAGLRKFPKGATLMISDMLCGQLKRIRQITLGDLVLSVLPWPFHKDLPKPDGNGPCADSMGEFCSLSIPIVTLCALIFLIILVALFNIFFAWLPLLFFCFRIRLSGKRK